MEYEGIVYVSCDFGIVQFDLETMLFGDTYFIGDNGAEISIRQTAVYNGFMQPQLMEYEAAISNKNLVDYKQWGLVATEWSGITTFGSDLFAVKEKS
jgi:hypothetical protein